MVPDMHGRRIAQPRGSAGRLGVGASGGNGVRYGTGFGGLGMSQAESPEFEFEEQQKQTRAATILESNEMLVWAGMDLCESLPQTKIHFEREVFSLSHDDSIKEWPESFAYSSEEEGTLQLGAIFTSEGWYDPKKHASVADRLQAQEAKEKARKEELEKARMEKTRSIGSPGVAMESSTRMTGEKGKRKILGVRGAKKQTGGVGGSKGTPSGSASGSSGV
ncbi:hypothetical protein E6O75_ATG02483 [Venturia nashicola]|uniref:Uncharacterized protein n=1 Tax=Venturia nashicola TaxID=86259 RepID=A0A4Z1P888_9PEZI|nr:hypothetical protein E6O75_ATG02483 [Venturia nashicola]